MNLNTTSTIKIKTNKRKKLPARAARAIPETEKKPNQKALERELSKKKSKEDALKAGERRILRL